MNYYRMTFQREFYSRYLSITSLQAFRNRNLLLLMKIMNIDEFDDDPFPLDDRWIFLRFKDDLQWELHFTFNKDYLDFFIYDDPLYAKLYFNPETFMEQTYYLY